MFYSKAHVEALNAQIEYLKAQLAEAKQECKDLLDRVLLKANVTPVSEPLASSREPIQVIAPMGVIPGEMEDLVKQSWLRTEAEHWMNEGYDEFRAKQMAEQEYLKQHRVIT